MNAVDGAEDRPVWTERLSEALDDNADRVYEPALDMLRCAGRWPNSSPAEAAVLIAFLEKAGGPELLLTRRKDDLVKHAGQVAFPGGARDPEDHDPEATALREAKEEVALPPSRVDVLGRLPRYPTTTGYLVTPIVGHVANPLELRRAPSEVAEIFTLPLAVLLDRDRWQQRILELEGMRVPYYEMHWDGQRIWGATAGMLQLLLPFLRHSLESAS